MALDLPNGFSDAPSDVQRELLEGKQGADLAREIGELIGEDVDNGHLRKEHKAEIILRLRNL